jgi:hypothetical protein
VVFIKYLYNLNYNMKIRSRSKKFDCLFDPYYFLRISIVLLLRLRSLNYRVRWFLLYFTLCFVFIPNCCCARITLTLTLTLIYGKMKKKSFEKKKKKEEQQENDDEEEEE